MDVLVIHLLNALLYASVLFLIAGGLSLIYGVMRIVNMAHGNLYAFGAYVTAWAIGSVAAGAPTALLLVLLPVGALAAAVLGAALEPTLLRPFYQRAEEYQLLVTFGLLMILEDLLRFVWGPYPLSASEVFENFGSLTLGDSLYPTYNFLVIGVGIVAATFLWAFIYKTRFGVVLRATSQNMRMASALGVNVNRVYIEAFTLGCFMAGLGGAMRWAVPIAVLLLVVPWIVPPYTAILLTYGLIMAIAALGFNLLLGYTGLLSFGHSAYFGVGAYVVALMVKYLKVGSMELFLFGAIIGSVIVTAVFGWVCVRYTRIFFSILTLALSQVLWSLAFKFFWVTGGTDGLRVPTPSLLVGLVTGKADKTDFMAHAYYHYVLVVFFAAVALMWVIVNSPFGKALQAIRDNETRAEFVGVQIWRYRFVAFLVSGVFTGLAGALWVPLNGLTTPDIIHWSFSGEMVFMTVLGGFRSFAGPIIGAVVFNYLKTYAVGYTVYWQLLLGAVLVVLVLSLPTGIVGTAGRLAARWKKGS